MSLTFFFDGSELHMYSRNYEVDPTHPDWRDACELAHRYFTSRIGGLSVFDIGMGMCVQTEYAGPGINGNRQKLAKRDLFVFAVWQDGEKLPRDEWEGSFLARAAPEVNPWEYPLADSMDTLISAVDGMRGHITPDALAGILLVIPLITATITDTITTVKHWREEPPSTKGSKQ